MSAVEFALVAPIFFMLFIEILQGGLYVFCTAAIEKATADAGRMVMLGALTTNAATGDAFRQNVVCPQLIAGLSCNNVVVSLQTTTLTSPPASGGYSIFVNAAENALIPVPMSTTQSAYFTGSPGTYGYIQAFYAVPIFSPIWLMLSNVINWNGSKVIFTRAAMAFRNEPFTTASVATGC